MKNIVLLVLICSIFFACNLFPLTIGAQFGYKHIPDDAIEYQMSTAFFAIKGKSGLRVFFRTNRVYTESDDMLKFAEAVDAGFPIMEYYTNARVAGADYLFRVSGEGTVGWYLTFGGGVEWRTCMARFNINGYSKNIQKESETDFMGTAGIMRSNKSYNWGIAYDTAPQGIMAYVGFAVEW